MFFVFFLWANPRHPDEPDPQRVGKRDVGIVGVGLTLPLFKMGIKPILKELRSYPFCGEMALICNLAMSYPNLAA